MEQKQSNAIDPRIVKFLHSEHLLSLCVLLDGVPYAASCFYAFDEQNLALLVASSSDSNHIKALQDSSQVAGTIALCTKIIGKIQGVQFRGTMSESDESGIYFRRFPYALAMKPKIFKIDLEWIKFTDNTLGFGTKLVWQARNQSDNGKFDS